jgi:hypothetical protein
MKVSPLIEVPVVEFPVIEFAAVGIRVRRDPKKTLAIIAICAAN